MIQYPDWVEKFRAPGRTIKKTKQGYALYKCTSVYVKGSNPKSVQEYLGKITVDGFIPKNTTQRNNSRMIEYGFTHFLDLNFKRPLIRSLYRSTSELAELVMIQYVFGVISEWTLSSSYLTYDHTEKLLEFRRTHSESRISNGSASLGKIVCKAIPDPKERQMLTAGLLICTISADNPVPPEVPSELRTIIEKARLRYE